MRRGRPRHDDILTPREWQVLDLLRDGLTNEQIASRLSISPDTARFHVSEILSKLGVESRQQAAAWQGRPRSAPVAGLPAALGRHVGALSPVKLAGGALIAAAAIALVALTAGVVLVDSNPGLGEEGATSEIDTGDEALDAIIESVLKDDAAQLATRFAGVTAREGFMVGGPVGLYRPQAVTAQDWTSRLASLSRSLYGVARPTEANNIPVDPPGQPGLYSSRIFLKEPRDYDIVLIAEGGRLPQHAWRFSVRDGDLIDVIIENPRLTDGTPGPDSVTVRVSRLLPNPSSQAANFLILPPERLWLAPTALPRSEYPGEPAHGKPSTAPDGRTGDSEIDSVIETLLS